MNLIKNEVKGLYRNLLIGCETKEEKKLLYISLLNAVLWSGKFVKKEPEIDYFSNLSLSENISLVSNALDITPYDIICSIKRDCVLAKKIFVYISSKKHSFNDISIFIEKKKDKAIEMYKSIDCSISLNDLDIIEKISKVHEYTLLEYAQKCKLKQAL